MYTPVVRLLLIFAATAGGILALPHRPWFSGAMFLAAALFLYGYFRYGTVWLAYRALKRGRLDRVERLVGQIHRPDWLRPQDRAYYEMLKGVLADEREDLSAAEAHLRAAIAGRLRTQNDRFVANIALAEVLVHRGEMEQAVSILATARALSHGPELEPHLDRVEELMRSS